MKLSIIGISSRHGLVRAASKLLIALTLFILALPCLVSAQTLQHEWSFNEPSGSTTATDSVAGANITLSGSTSLGGGILTLPGGAGNWAQFPNGILSTNNSITIETWLTDNQGQTWARAWSFGGSTTGPNNNFIQNNYIDLIPTAGAQGGYWTEFKQGGTVDAVDLQPLPTGTEEYTAVTYDLPSKTVRLYLNGVQVAIATGVTISPASLGFTYNNFIGLDQWNDAVFNGTFDEMRIWTAPVSQRYLAASAVAGPSVLINNLTPTSVSVTAGPGVVITGTEQATVNVTLPQTGASVLLATGDATNWISSNPGVLTVSSSGLITGVGAGSATVSATVGGVTATSGSITTTPLALLHRYSFTNDASDSVGGPAWDGTLVGASGGLNATIANGLILPGNTVGGFGYSGYVSLPGGILTNTTSVTVECWATQNQGNNWATIWDFANNNNVNFGLIPFPGNNNQKMEVAVNPNGNDIYTASTILFPNNSEQYISYTFNDSTLTGNLYTNGALIATQAYPDHTYTPGSFGGAGGTTQNMLGNDIYGDDQFGGTVYEFRIWNGVVSPMYLAASTVAGPGVVVTNTTVQSLNVALTTTSMIGSQTQQATVTGNFLQVSGVPLTALATNWTSSNPNVLTVNGSGLITAQSGGSATVSATVAGVTQASALITVSDSAPTFLQKPVNQNAILHDAAVFSAQALGGHLSYQWSYNGTPISGATSTNLTVPNVAFTQAGTYSLLVSNDIGTTNASATLTVIAASLQHEWSFNESGGSTAYDSIENSNITLFGSTSLGGGVLTLPGGAQGSGNYAQFPNGMLSTYSNSITIETWLTDNGGQTWSRAWSFGGETTGPNNNFIQNNYLDLIPHAGAGGGLWTEFRQNYNTQDIINQTPLQTNVKAYITVIYNASSQTCTMYSNGVQIALGTGIATTPASFGFTYNNYIGLDQWNDQPFYGSIDEMRIWNGVVSQLYLNASAVAGPSVVINNLTPTSISVTAGSAAVITGTEQAAVSVTLPQTGATILSATGDVTNWISSNPGVLTVSSSGLITGVGIGSATVSATVNGVTGTSSSITVAPQALLHRYSFTNNASDSVGGPAWNGTLVPQGAGTAATIANGLTLPGGGGGGYSGYLSLPNGILTNTTSLTVECWATQDSANNWATPWAFAVQPGVNFALIPNPGPAIVNNGQMVVAVNPNNNDIYTTSGVTFPNGSEQYVSYTFNNASLIANLYTNGVLVGTQAYPDHTYCPGSIGGAGGTTQNWLGNDTYGDTQFQGTIYEFRIWNGAVSPVYLAASALAGPSVVITNTTPQSVSVSVTTSMVTSQTQQASATGTFLQVSGVPLAFAVTNWISSNPGVLTVNSNGVITAVHTGSATVSATVSGVTGTSSSITVSPLTIGVTRSGSNLVLNWQTGLLLQAPTVSGPWTTNNAASPPTYTVSTTNGSQFFKILIP